MITLTNNRARVVINPEGAWVEELTDNEQPILFAKTELVSDSGERKARGGMHVCLPNFGPGGDSGLAQHGFGRTSQWKVTHQNSTSVSLFLKGEAIRYSSLEADLTYQLGAHQLSATLVLRNRGVTSVRVAPGFHPYFFLDESDSAFSINGRVYELTELSGTEFIDVEKVSVETSTRQLTLSQHNLSRWAIWTDGLANYVCVEPTYSGYCFLEPSSPDEHLAPGSERVFSCTITW